MAAVVVVVAAAGYTYWAADFAPDEVIALPEPESKSEPVAAPEPAPEPESPIDAGSVAPASDLPLTLSNADILGVIRAHEDELYTCAKDHREQHPGATGTLRIRWRIDLAGATTEIVALSAELETSAFVRCMVKEISRWKFPPHREPRDPIDFPFRF